MAKADENVEQLKAAKALLDRGIELRQQNKHEEAVAAFDKVVELFERTQHTELQESVARALVNKGITLWQQNKPEEEIAAYDKLISLFEQSKHTKLQEYVAKALVNKGIALGQDRPEKEIMAYDKVVELFGRTKHTELQESVAKALVNKGITLGQQNKHKEEIVAYDKVVALFEQSTYSELQRQVATALFNKGNTLGQQDKLYDSIAAYDKVVALFEQSTYPEPQELVAMALVNKGSTLWQQNKPDDAIAAYDKVVALFEKPMNTNQKLQEPVARSLFYKASTLWQQNKPDDAIAAYGNVVGLFGMSTDFKIKIFLAQTLIKLWSLRLNSEVNEAFFENLFKKYDMPDGWSKIKGWVCAYIDEKFFSWQYLTGFVKDEKEYVLLLWALIVIFEKCNEKIQKEQQQIREDNTLKKVCHFTDLNALYSILGYSPGNKELENGKNVLRAYNAIYMNDPSEGKALVKYSHRHPDKEIPDLTEFFKDEEHTWIEHDAAKSVYSISFTKDEDKDSLTLWRAYGRDGYGVCIVIPVSTFNQFDSINSIRNCSYFQKPKNEFLETVEPSPGKLTTFNEKFTDNNISENLFLVRYISCDWKNKSKNESDGSLNEKKKSDEEFADGFLKSLKEPLDEIKCIKNRYKGATEEINKAVREAFAGALYLFKDAQYESEHEYRMLEMRPLNDKSIEMDEQFPPRLFLKTRPFVFEDPATSLIIGPAVENPENVKLSVEHILTKKDSFSEEIKIEFSTVNYRPAKK